MKLRTLWANPRWRKLSGEIGIVTLGVLIALAVGEIAEAAHWRVRVATSMDSTKAELAEHRAHVVERQIFQSCVDDRLSQIGAILADAKRTGSLPAVASIGSTGIRPFSSSAFEVAQSEGVPLHMNQTDAQKLAAAYEYTNNYRLMIDQETGSWATLQLLEGPGGPIDSNLLTLLLQAWSEAKQANHYIKLIGRQANRRLREFGVAIGDVRTASDRAEFIELAREAPVCDPLS